MSLRLRCDPHGNVVTSGTTVADVPLLALYERSMWLSGFDVPTLLVWADGTVVYGDEPYGKSFRLFQAQLSAEDALEILQTVTSHLRDAPAESSMSDATDQPSVQIMFRDGEVWRIVEAYGMRRTTTADEVPAPLRTLFTEYRALLDRRPPGRVPAPTGYPRPKGWPDELPTFRGQHIVDQLARCANQRSLDPSAPWAP